MSKRINIILPAETLAVLDRVAPKGHRSQFISQAVLHYVESRSKNELRDRLKREALANADRDLAMVTEWFPLEEEAFSGSSPDKRRPRIPKAKRS